MKKEGKEKVNTKNKDSVTKKKAVKKISFNKLVKPYMDFLGVIKYNAIPLNYYSGTNRVYIIETEFLETFFLKVYDKDEYKFAASIEKHFIVNAKNIGKMTPHVNVAHDADDKLDQFLFTDMLPGANKKWNLLNAEEKSQVVKQIAKVLFKIHTYTSKRIMKEDIFGKVSDPEKSWMDYLGKKIKEKVSSVKKESSSEGVKLAKYFEDQMFIISSSQIKPVLLHNGITLTKNGVIRSLLFLGTKISGILNSEESIYGDKLWDVAKIYKYFIGKNEVLEKDFSSEYGKLKPEEKERIQMYIKLL